MAMFDDGITFEVKAAAKFQRTKLDTFNTRMVTRNYST